MKKFQFRRSDDGEIRFLREQTEADYRLGEQIGEPINLRDVVLSGIPQYIVDMPTFDDSVLHPYPYAGRGSFGLQWLAVNLDREAMNESAFGAALVASAMQRWADELGVPDVDTLLTVAGILVEFLSNTRTDSMGLDIVIYWPEFVCVQVEAESEESDGSV